MADDKKRDPITGNGAPADANAAPPDAERVPSVQGGLSALASAGAPFVFFDGVASINHAHGVGGITLVAHRTLATPIGKNEVAADYVITGMLRASYPALRTLRDTINLLLKGVEPGVEAEPPEVDHPPPPMMN